MKVKHKDMGREQVMLVDEFVRLRLTEYNDGGELEQMRRQLDRNTELLAKLAALAVKSEEDLRALVYVDPWHDEVVE